MKKKIFKIAIPAVIVVVVIVAVVMNLVGNKATYVEKPDMAKVEAAIKLLNESYLEEGESPDVYYCDFIGSNQYESGEGEYTATLVEGINKNVYADDNRKNENVPKNIATNAEGIYLKELAYGDVAEYNLEVDKAGLYNINLEYISVGTTLSDYTVSLTVNGESQYMEMSTILLPIHWTDSKDYETDSYGDEIAPIQKRNQRWVVAPLYDNTYASSTPLVFYLEEGMNKIQLKNVSSGGLVVCNLEAVASKNADVPTYKEYLSSHSGEKLVTGTKPIEINAIDYTEKNSTEATYGAIANAALTPFDIDNDKLNVLSWKEAGTEITYTVSVPETGLYNLAFHYQNEKDDFVAFETIKIDGEVPFEEMYNYQFDPVTSGWENEVITDADGNPYKFYLGKGVHRITLKCELSPVMEAYRYALLIEKHVTDFELAITKVTGSDVDKDRAWKMRKYIPEIEQYLNAYKVLLDYIRYLIQDYSEGGTSGAILTYLDKAETFVDNNLEYPDEIALHKEDLTGKDNSILQAMSQFTTQLLGGSFTLDRMYLYGEDDDLPSANESVFSTAWIATKQLLNTFLSDKYSTNVDEKADDTITIWVNKAISYVDLMQKYADTQFTPATGIKVRITTMPDAGKLTLAVASGETPDIALGLQSYIPFDLASRGSLYDMTKFDDFWEVAGRFPSGSFVSYVYNEGVYALPETTDFNVIAYRTDIFDSLGIEKVPDTWDELITILPTLQRYGKNFYHNIGIADVSYKWFYQTTPMILQNGGALYAEDGLTTTVDSKDAVKGLQVLGDLFTKYALPESVGQFFDAFRYGTLPIGIIGMGEYTLISNGASELDGKWAIAPYIGTQQSDGTIDRTFIANGTGGIIFGGNDEPTQKQKNAWEFLKWWTSAEVQTEYAYALRSTHGKTYFWLSANLEALQNVPMPEADKQVILKQIEWVTDTPRTPGQYLLERTISNVWTTMVFDGTSAQVAVDEAVLDVNKEITRKMKEFGFIDENGNQVKSYVIRGKDWIEENQEKARQEGGNQ